MLSFAELAKKFAQVRCKSPFEVESKNRKETLLIFFVFSRWALLLGGGWQCERQLHSGRDPAHPGGSQEQLRNPQGLPTLTQFFLVPFCKVIDVPIG